MSEPTSRWRGRLTEPSSAAGLAALLALIVPSLADRAPVLVELGLSAIAAVAEGPMTRAEVGCGFRREKVALMPACAL